LFPLSVLSEEQKREEAKIRKSARKAQDFHAKQREIEIEIINLEKRIFVKKRQHDVPHPLLVIFSSLFIRNKQEELEEWDQLFERITKKPIQEHER